MNPFAQFVVQQQLHQTMPVEDRRSKEIKPYEGDLRADLLQQIRLTPDQDVQALAAAMQLNSLQLHQPLQHLKKKGAIEPVGQVNKRNLWRAVKPC